MAKKLKICLGIAGLALLIAVSMIAYNTLVGWVGLANRLALPEQADPAYSLALPEHQAPPRQRAPDFAMTDWDGNSLRFSDIIAGGKPVVLNFWASWCHACRSEKPGFETVYRDLGAKVKFAMVGLVDGVRETVETGQRYIETNGFTLPVYFDTLREGAVAYGVRFLPTTVFIDANGYIITQTHGATDEETLRIAIDFMLPGVD